MNEQKHNLVVVDPNESIDKVSFVDYSDFNS
jgi:hypothetical protein